MAWDLSLKSSLFVIVFLLLTKILSRKLWFPEGSSESFSWLGLTSPVFARILLSQFRENLPSSVSEEVPHPLLSSRWYLIIWYLTLVYLYQESCQVCLARFPLSNYLLPPNPRPQPALWLKIPIFPCIWIWAQFQTCLYLIDICFIVFVAFLPAVSGPSSW